MSYYSIDGIFHKNMYENFNEPVKVAKYDPKFSIIKNNNSRKKEEKLKEINKLLKMNDLQKINYFIQKNKLINFYDKYKNLVTLNITNDNDICISKLEKDICLKDSQFEINIDQQKKLNQIINKKLEIKNNNLKEQKINKQLGIFYSAPEPVKIKKIKPNFFVNY
uniref:Uncharacterized protein n=1 Tax=viral metagenome TaxID=1070528 RepID=A0A6C0H276_9ZZZZ